VNVGFLLGGFFDSTWDYICVCIDKVIYAIWRFLASIAVVLEQIFRKLAGIDSGVIIKNMSVTNADGTVSSSTQLPNTSNTDIVSLLIRAPVVQNIFSALVVIAIILLLFFAILQIIREQYKNKDGGNPYMIVFRTFKGMIMFLFVTAACMVGLMVSGYVLTAVSEALDRSTNSTVAGSIFGAMAYNANRLRLAPYDSAQVQNLYNILVGPPQGNDASKGPDTYLTRNPRLRIAWHGLPARGFGAHWFAHRKITGWQPVPRQSQSRFSGLTVRAAVRGRDAVR